MSPRSPRLLSPAASQASPHAFVVCRICEERVAAAALERHSQVRRQHTQAAHGSGWRCALPNETTEPQSPECLATKPYTTRVRIMSSVRFYSRPSCQSTPLQMCAALDEVEGQEPGIDARLTRLAAALDDRLEDFAGGGSGDALSAMGGLGGSDMDDLEGLVAFARSAAALQPDGTRLPARRCQVRTLSLLAGELVGLSGVAFCRVLTRPVGTPRTAQSYDLHGSVQCHGQKWHPWDLISSTAPGSIVLLAEPLHAAAEHRGAAVGANGSGE